jgi:hypothetical protein
MIDNYNFYEQIKSWEEDLEYQEKAFLRENCAAVFPTQQIINKIISYSRAQSVYSETLNENIKVWLN